MTRTRLTLLLTAAVVAAVMALAARRSAPAPGTATPGMATVTGVVDGDTLHVRLAGRSERVRLIGIDTPESVKPRTPVECFAKEASARTHALLPAGTTVRLVRDVEARDRYGRLLAYVYRPSDGLFVNLALARDGYAAPLTIPPNVAHSGEFAAASGQARLARRGLWAACGGPHERGSGGAAAARAGAGANEQAVAPP
ncbi:MAG: micrococcal nuclease [Acidimicrobiaceae bacterium]|nr:micrococcal nuclease [Acidimicrobiaceae bacterium]